MAEKVADLLNIGTMTVKLFFVDLDITKSSVFDVTVIQIITAQDYFT
jgi:hypothetical protein